MIKVNADNFDMDNLTILKENLVTSLIDSISSDSLLERRWINYSQCFYKIPTPIHETIKDIIDYSFNSIQTEKKYNIREYLIVKEFYDKALKVKNRGERISYLEDLHCYWNSNRDEDDVIKFIPMINNLNQPSRFQDKINNKDHFKLFIEDILFKNYLNFNEVCKEIFDYYKFLSPIRDDLIRAMNLNVCPYCNEYNIHNLEDRVLADLDHFLLQSEYPLFALTIDNFVPSCTTCNRTLKGVSVEKIINPRIEGFDDDAVFKYSGSPLDSKSDDFKLVFKMSECGDENKVKRIVSSIKLFQLEGRYNNESILSEAKSFYHRTQMYSNIIKKPEMYMILFPEWNKDDIKEENILEVLLGFNPHRKDILNVQYGKMKYDLFKHITS